MPRGSRIRTPGLPDKLKTIRDKTNLSQDKFYLLINPLANPNERTSAIHEFENGVREPSLFELKNYAKIVNVSIDVLADPDRSLNSPTLKQPIQGLSMKLKKIRDKTNLSPQLFIKLINPSIDINTDYNPIRDYEAGIAEPTLAEIIQYAKLAKITVQKLLNPSQEL